MSDQTPTPETDTTADVEGHGRFRGGIVADSDDVEGHMPYRRVVGDEVESGDDGQVPGAVKKF